MKRSLLFFSLFMITAVSVDAQCDKTLAMKSSKTMYLDSTNKVQRTEDEITNMEITKTSISISPGETYTMTGPVSSYVCNWTSPYKEGKLELKAAVTDDKGNTRNITAIIEGKEGKTFMTVLMEDLPNMKIRVELDKFEEKK